MSFHSNWNRREQLEASNSSTLFPLPFSSPCPSLPRAPSASFSPPFTEETSVLHMSSTSPCFPISSSPFCSLGSSSSFSSVHLLPLTNFYEKATLPFCSRSSSLSHDGQSIAFALPGGPVVWPIGDSSSDSSVPSSMPSSTPPAYPTFPPSSCFVHRPPLPQAVVFPFRSSEELYQNRRHLSRMRHVVSWGMHSHNSQYLAFSSGITTWIIDVTQSTSITSLTSSSSSPSPSYALHSSPPNPIINPSSTQSSSLLANNVSHHHSSAPLSSTSSTSHRQRRLSSSPYGSRGYSTTHSNTNVISNRTSSATKIPTSCGGGGNSWEEYRSAHQRQLRQGVLKSAPKILESPSVGIVDVSWSLVSPSLLSTSTEDGFIQIWDTRLHCRRPVQSCLSFAAVTMLAWNPFRGERLAGSDVDVVQVWDLRNLHMKHFTPVLEAPIVSLSWSPHSSETFLTLTSSLSFEREGRKWNSSGFSGGGGGGGGDIMKMKEKMFSYSAASSGFYEFGSSIGGSGLSRDGGTLSLWNCNHMSKCFTAVPLRGVVPTSACFVPKMRGILVAGATTERETATLRGSLSDIEIGGHQRAEKEERCEGDDSLSDLCTLVALYSSSCAGGSGGGGGGLVLSRVFSAINGVVSSLHCAYSDCRREGGEAAAVRQGGEEGNLSDGLSENCGEWKIVGWDNNNRCLTAWPLKAFHAPSELLISRRTGGAAEESSAHHVSVEELSEHHRQRREVEELRGEWKANLRKALLSHATKLREMPYVVDTLVEEISTAEGTEQLQQEAGEEEEDDEEEDGEQSHARYHYLHHLLNTNGSSKMDPPLPPYVQQRLQVVISLPSPHSSNHKISNATPVGKATTLSNVILGTAYSFLSLQITIDVRINLLYLVNTSKTPLANANKVTTTSTTLSSSLGAEDISYSSSAFSSTSCPPPSARVDSSSSSEGDMACVGLRTETQLGSVAVSVKWGPPYQQTEWGPLSSDVFLRLLTFRIEDLLPVASEKMVVAVKRLTEVLSRRESDVLSTIAYGAPASLIPPLSMLSVVGTDRRAARQPFPVTCGICWSPLGGLLYFHSFLGVEQVWRMIRFPGEATRVSMETSSSAPSSFSYMAKDTSSRSSSPCNSSTNMNITTLSRETHTVSSSGYFLEDGQPREKGGLLPLRDEDNLLLEDSTHHHGNRGSRSSGVINCPSSASSSLPYKGPSLQHSQSLSPKSDYRYHADDPDPHHSRGSSLRRSPPSPSSYSQTLISPTTMRKTATAAASPAISPASKTTTPTSATAAEDRLRILSTSSTSRVVLTGCQLRLTFQDFLLILRLLEEEEMQTQAFRELTSSRLGGLRTPSSLSGFSGAFLGIDKTTAGISGAKRNSSSSAAPSSSGRSLPSSIAVAGGGMFPLGNKFRIQTQVVLQHTLTMTPGFIEPLTFVAQELFLEGKDFHRLCLVNQTITQHFDKSLGLQGQAWGILSHILQLINQHLSSPLVGDQLSLNCFTSLPSLAVQNQFAAGPIAAAPSRKPAHPSSSSYFGSTSFVPPLSPSLPSLFAPFCGTVRVMSSRPGQRLLLTPLVESLLQSLFQLLHDTKDTLTFAFIGAVLMRYSLLCPVSNEFSTVCTQVFPSAGEHGIVPCSSSGDDPWASSSAFSVSSPREMASEVGGTGGERGNRLADGWGEKELGFFDPSLPVASSSSFGSLAELRRQLFRSRKIKNSNYNSSGKSSTFSPMSSFIFISGRGGGSSSGSSGGYYGLHSHPHSKYCNASTCPAFGSRFVSLAIAEPQVAVTHFGRFCLDASMYRRNSTKMYFPGYQQARGFEGGFHGECEGIEGRGDKEGKGLQQSSLSVDRQMMSDALRSGEDQESGEPICLYSFSSGQYECYPFHHPQGPGQQPYSSYGDLCRCVSRTLLSAVSRLVSWNRSVIVQTLINVTHMQWKILHRTSQLTKAALMLKLLHQLKILAMHEGTKPNSSYSLSTKATYSSSAAAACRALGGGNISGHHPSTCLPYVKLAEGYSLNYNSHHQFQQLSLHSSLLHPPSNSFASSSPWTAAALPTVLFPLLPDFSQGPLTVNVSAMPPSSSSLAYPLYSCAASTRGEEGWSRQSAAEERRGGCGRVGGNGNHAEKDVSCSGGMCQWRVQQREGCWGTVVRGGSSGGGGGENDGKTPEGMKSETMICGVCGFAARGLRVVCQLCGHGGHPQHLKFWFEKTHGGCAVLNCNCQCSIAAAA